MRPSRAFSCAGWSRWHHYECMEETLERDIRRAARKGVPVGIIMFDIDHFKNINDTFGHEAGDALLQELGNFLSTQFRQEDIVCRTGGEEFTVILPEADAEQPEIGRSMFAGKPSSSPCSIAAPRWEGSPCRWG